MNNEFDVVIVGGGPAGSTAGCLLKKYMPNLSVLILEKAKFPRDHVGESQLPMIGRVLREMGCWEKCEAADFPIKVGATYRWGNSDELWDFNFVDPEQVEELTRPGNYEGPRVSTAWQVDRAVYDEILLDHAQEMGCEVRQESQVTKIVLDESDSDAIGHLVIKGTDGESYEKSEAGIMLMPRVGLGSCVRGLGLVWIRQQLCRMLRFGITGRIRSGPWKSGLEAHGCRCSRLALVGCGLFHWGRRGRALALSARLPSIRNLGRHLKRCINGRSLKSLA